MADKLYTQAELKGKTSVELKHILNNHPDVEADSFKKQDLIDALLTIDAPEDDELDDDEVDDEEELDDATDDIDPDELDDEELDDEVDVPEEKTTKAKAKAPAKPRAAKQPKAEGEGNTIAAKQVAVAIGTEAKTLRQFFRSGASTIEPVGSGGRYEFTEDQVPTIKSEFDTWKAGHAGRGGRRTKAEGGKAEPTVAAIEEVEEIEELEDNELDDEIEDADLELEDDDELED